MQNKKLGVTLVAVGLVCILSAMALMPVQNDVTKEEIPTKLKTWQALGDYDPGAGAGGFQRIVIKALPVGSSTNPNSNASVAVNLTDIDADGTNADIPHSTKFGIYIFARFNATQAYSVGNATWVDAWTRCNITGANLSIGPIFCNRTQVDTAGTEYVYECFYIELNSTGEPLMLARDQRLDLTSITLEAYY
jgi:hypothetical protein